MDPDGTATHQLHVLLEIAGGQITAVSSVVNPEKLRHLASLASAISAGG